MRTWLLFFWLFSGMGCQCGGPAAPAPQALPRCEVDLQALGLFSQEGTTAMAKAIESSEELIGGPHAHGEVGDFLIQNDRIRAVIQRPGRLVGVNPYGGNLIDADLRRAGGEAGRDQFGEVAPLYAFGRTPLTEQVEILSDGSQGGAAVIAATGLDTVNDYMNIPNVLEQVIGPFQLASDPNTALPLRTTTYYVLSPGEARVRMLTAFCNDGEGFIYTSVGDLLEQGGQVEFFNPNGCARGMGNRGCLVDSFPWFGLTGKEVAYGYRTYTFDNLSTPEPANTLLSIAGVVGVMASGVDVSGVLTWTDPNVRKRPGVFFIEGGAQKLFLRDFFVGRDLGAISSELTSLDEPAFGSLLVQVTDAKGHAAEDARVVVQSMRTGKTVTVMSTDRQGKAAARLPIDTYALRAAALGSALLPGKEAVLVAGNETQVDLSLGPSQKLTVSVRDPFGQPLPAKVTVLCQGGLCPGASTDYELFYQNELLPSNVAAVAFVPPQGTTHLFLPAGKYELVVTRGPEYSAWPDTWPQLGERVDVSSSDVSVEAVLAPVIDTSGWMSADLHVHAVNSPDSSVGHPLRVQSFAAEGVDVLVATDHDVITDLRPVIESLGAQAFVASLPGQEITPFDFGHQNAFPLTVSKGPNGGAFDWAGGAGPTLRLGQLYSALRERFPNVVIQMNHPRSTGSGSLTALQVDTDTLSSQADPARFRMEAAPDARAEDTGLFSPLFDALEVQNGLSPNRAVMNDWMTFLSQGLLKTATAVSDTHLAYSHSGGYSRTYVQVTPDTPASLDADAFSRALKNRYAIGTNGPFLHVTATRLDANQAPVGGPVEVGDTLSLNAAAGEKVLLRVRIQSPEWLTFDTIEVHTHAGGREARKGVANDSWPTERIHQVRTLNPAALPLVPVAGTNGVNVRRIDVEETFLLSPTQDTWYVVMVHGGASSRALFPLAINGTNCTDGVCTARQDKAFAFTNALLIDADNSGAYDAPPAAKRQGLRQPTPPPEPRPARVPTVGEFEEALRQLLHRH